MDKTMIRSGLISGAKTGLGTSVIHIILGANASFDASQVTWIILSILLGGIAGGIGEFLGKLLKFNERFGIDGAVIGFFAALVIYLVQFWAMIGYSIMNPVFFP